MGLIEGQLDMTGVSIIESETLPEKRERHSRIIPFGFVIDTSDPTTLIADPELYKHIFQIRKMRASGASYAECREYLKAHTGKEMTRMDVKRIIDREY